MSLQYAGETVQLVSLRCVNYGRKKVYKVTASYDGIEFPAGEDFWELEDMLVQAGYAKPMYQHRAVIAMHQIDVVLEAHDSQYRVQAVYKSDGTGTVTREQVLQAQADKRAARQANRTHEIIPITQEKFAFAPSYKRVKKTIPDDRFLLGERLNRETLARLQQDTQGTRQPMYQLRNAAWLKGWAA